MKTKTKVMFLLLTVILLISIGLFLKPKPTGTNPTVTEEVEKETVPEEKVELENKTNTDEMNGYSGITVTVKHTGKTNPLKSVGSEEIQMNLPRDDITSESEDLEFFTPDASNEAVEDLSTEILDDDSSKSLLTENLDEIWNSNATMGGFNWYGYPNEGYWWNINTARLGIYNDDFYWGFSSPGNIIGDYPVSPPPTTAVPEPFSLLLVGTGLLGIVSLGRKRAKF